MIYILDNLAPILAAMLAGAVVGLIALRLGGRVRPGPARLAIAVLALFWLAAILAGGLILAPPQVRAQAGDWTIALGTPAIIWAGFVLPVCAASLPVLGRSGKTTLAVAGAWLVVMLTMGAVMQAVGLVAPQG